MKRKLIKDLMLPLEEYAVVSDEATLFEAIITLEKSQINLPAGCYMHRAVLITNKKREVVGKLGHLAILKALGPHTVNVSDMHSVSQSGLSHEFLNFMMDDMGFWESNICRESKVIMVKDIMHPVKECIDINDTIQAGIQKIIKWNALSIPVTDGKKVVGVLRLTELFQETTRSIVEMEC